MNQGVLGHLTVCLLDYNRPVESERCLRSIREHLLVRPVQVLYLANGGDQEEAKAWYNGGLIDTLLLNKANVGCGIAMKQMAAAAMTEWVMMVQTDQYLIRPYTQLDFERAIELLRCPDILYYDLAGNQGQGRASERAHLINRRRYLDIPGMDDVIGGPGPYAQSLWTERHVQNYMAAIPNRSGLSFVSDSATTFFADNGAYSEREYPERYGVDGVKPQTRHRTDTKKLWVLRPFGCRAEGFPNLNLNNEEWADVLAGRWPFEGRIPEADKAHSFVVWPE